MRYRTHDNLITFKNGLGPLMKNSHPTHPHPLHPPWNSNCHASDISWSRHSVLTTPNVCGFLHLDRGPLLPRRPRVRREQHELRQVQLPLQRGLHRQARTAARAAHRAVSEEERVLYPQRPTSKNIKLRILFLVSNVFFCLYCRHATSSTFAWMEWPTRLPVPTLSSLIRTR